jgi:hypothetical protein
MIRSSAGVVTATKQTESIDKVPISITAGASTCRVDQPRLDSVAPHGNWTQISGLQGYSVLTGALGTLGHRTSF